VRRLAGMLVDRHPANGIDGRLGRVRRFSVHGKDKGWLSVSI
jgi:hypothetical protein